MVKLRNLHMSSSLIDRILLKADDSSVAGGDDALIVMPKLIMASQVGSIDPWSDAAKEGELSVDVYQDEGAVVIQAAIAGVRSEDIAIEVQNDIVTIRGTRHPPADVANDRYLCRECFWGPFSRTIVLPFEVKSADAGATFQNGILTLILPHASQSGAVAAIPINDLSYE